MRRKKQAITNPSPAPSTGKAYQELVEQLYADRPTNTTTTARGQQAHVEDDDLGILCGSIRRDAS